MEVCPSAGRFLFVRAARSSRSPPAYTAAFTVANEAAWGLLTLHGH